MKELIKVVKQKIGDEEVNAVDARYLWLSLESKRKYADWVKAKLDKTMAIEGVDYLIHNIVKQHKSGSKHIIEYIVTIDIAKHIAMLEGTEKGREVRQYFIEVEKEFKKQLTAIPNFNNPAIAARAWADEYEKRIEVEKEVKLLTPKAQYFDKIVDRNLLTNFRDTAKELGVSQSDFIAFLKTNKYIYRTSIMLRPYAVHVTKGLFEVKEWANEHKAGLQTLITPKGRETFRLLLQGV